MNRLVPFFWLLCSGLLLAGGKKEQDIIVTFHLQGSSADGLKMSAPEMVAGGEVYFRRSPEVSTKDISSFRPFASNDGYSYGVVFLLNDIGRKRLTSVTNASRRKLMLSRLNGRPLDVVEIDRTIDDGVLVIWQGVSTQEIAALDRMMPRIGETVKEWKEKKKNS
ncbi:MAG: hypothetical protein AAGC74_00385 [Verrucomicrobiota bacterium]